MPTVITIGFNQTDFTAIEGTDGVVTVYVAVLQGDLRASVSVIISTQILILDTATRESFLVGITLRKLLGSGLFNCIKTLIVSFFKHVLWTLISNNYKIIT